MSIFGEKSFGEKSVIQRSFVGTTSTRSFFLRDNGLNHTSFHTARVNTDWNLSCVWWHVGQKWLSSSPKCWIFWQIWKKNLTTLCLKTSCVMINISTCLHILNTAIYKGRHSTMIVPILCQTRPFEKTCLHTGSTTRSKLSKSEKMRCIVKSTIQHKKM